MLIREVFELEDPIIRFENVSKQYKLGIIGGTTLKEEFQRFGAKMRHQEDPTAKINLDNNKEIMAKNGESFWALQDINIDIKKGETLGIIGRNGAGKSTLLKLLCRITAPTTGTISYNGRIASMLEVGTGFHGELTGRENIYLNGAILGMSKKEITKKIEKIIEFSECSQFIDTPVKRYSSGMYVKLAFSVSAFLDAEIMIMDEVLAVGDVAFQQKCIARMKELARQEKRTVLYVSHLLPTVSELCERSIVLEQGHIGYDGKTSDAINYYLEHDVATSTFIDYTGMIRKGNFKRNSISLMSASFENKKTAIFHDDESIFLRLNYKLLEDSEDISFRLEISTVDGRPVATSFMDRFIHGKEGEEQSVLLKYDFPELTEGRYETKFTFFYHPETGNTVNIDVLKGLSFEKKYVTVKRMNWNAEKWGNIKLSSPEIVE